MQQIIYPRSPRETMAGWAHLPRFVDKIRLHLAGKLDPMYQERFTKGFDGLWLEAAGMKAAEFIEMVGGTITDGQVCDWVRQHVRRSAAEQAAFNSGVLTRGREGKDLVARLAQIKQESGLGHRAEIQTFVDFIDADEKRL